MSADEARRRREHSSRESSPLSPDLHDLSPFEHNSHEADARREADLGEYGAETRRGKGKEVEMRRTGERDDDEDELVLPLSSYIANARVMQTRTTQSMLLSPLASLESRLLLSWPGRLLRSRLGLAPGNALIVVVLALAGACYRARAQWRGILHALALSGAMSRSLEILVDSTPQSTSRSVVDIARVRDSLAFWLAYAGMTLAEQRVPAPSSHGIFTRLTTSMPFLRARRVMVHYLVVVPSVLLLRARRALVKWAAERPLKQDRLARLVRYIALARPHSSAFPQPSGALPLADEHNKLPALYFILRTIALLLLSDGRLAAALYSNVVDPLVRVHAARTRRRELQEGRRPTRREVIVRTVPQDEPQQPVASATVASSYEQGAVSFPTPQHIPYKLASSLNPLAGVPRAHINGRARVTTGALRHSSSAPTTSAFTSLAAGKNGPQALLAAAAAASAADLSDPETDTATAASMSMTSTPHHGDTSGARSDDDSELVMADDTFGIGEYMRTIGADSSDDENNSQDEDSLGSSSFDAPPPPPTAQGASIWDRSATTTTATATVWT